MSQPHLNIIFLSFASPFQDLSVYHLMWWLDRLQIHQIIFQGLFGG